MDGLQSLFEEISYNGYSSSQLLGSIAAILASWLAIKLVSNCILARRERAINLKIAIPPQLHRDWKGRTWNEVDQATKSILEGQAKGVSSSFNLRYGQVMEAYTDALNFSE